MKPKHGDLRIWWIPQVPMKAFNMPVKNLVEARLLLDTLAYYDLFQLENNVKPDYSNAGGLSVYDDISEHDWIDWLDQEGKTIDGFTLEELREHEPTWEMASDPRGTWDAPGMQD